MMDMLNSWSRTFRNRSLGLLLIRIGTGLVFFMHGWAKLHGLGMVNGMMTGMGFPHGTGYFIAYLETLGGLALILGIFPRAFAAAFSIEMLVAIIVTGGVGRGYQPHELELFLMLMSLGIVFAGSGRYSLWAMECHHCGAMTCKGEKGVCPAR